MPTDEMPEFIRGLPLPAPVPAKGCETCASYMRSIAERRKRDESAAADYRVLMRRHLASEHS